MNRVILFGTVGHRMVMETSPDGQSVTTFDLLTSRPYRDRDGQLAEDVERHQVVTTGRLAEICDQYVGPGRQVYLEGRLRTSRDVQAGQVTEVFVDTLQLIGRDQEVDLSVPVADWNPPESSEKAHRIPYEDDGL